MVRAFALWIFDWFGHTACVTALPVFGGRFSMRCEEERVLDW
jgi:hypothetical protein